MSLAIDVGIGLAFVFALVALMCTGLQELLAAALNLRGKTLWEGIASMLQANAAADAKSSGQPAANALTDKPAGDGMTPDRKSGDDGMTPDRKSGDDGMTADRKAGDNGTTGDRKAEGDGMTGDRKAGGDGSGGAHLDAGLQLEQEMRAHPLIVAVVPDRFGPIGFVAWMFGFRKPSADIGSSKPSYLQASTFATVLADAIGKLWKGGSRRYDDFPQAVAAMPNGPLKSILQGFILDTRGDPLKLRAAIEAWFDEAMERIGGWYKRRVQVLLLVVGLIVSGALNIDAIHIANALWTQPALRTAVADRAVAASAKAATPAAAASAARNELTELHVPMGWTAERQTGAADIALMVVGWFITALAASFGAPFWFDLIGKLVPLRSSGPKPVSLPEQPAPARPIANIDAAVRGVAEPYAQGPEPFRGALNDFEARSLTPADIVDIKRRLGLPAQGARSALLDQTTRDAIREQQKTMGWPDTGELSARWVQALRGA